MGEVISRPEAGYAFLKGGTHPFSRGVACLKGHTLTRIRFRKPPPLAEGLAQAASYIEAQGRPLAALAACELRSPAQMSLPDFAAFNRTYVEQLRANGFPSEAPFRERVRDLGGAWTPPSKPTPPARSSRYCNSYRATESRMWGLRYIRLTHRWRRMSLRRMCAR